MLDEFLGVDGVQITAVCDIVKDKCLNAKQVIEKAGQKSPAVFFNGDHDFENLCKRDDVDFVYIATPWDWHVPMAVAAMKNGKHTGVEVPAAVTLKECWELVETSEKTRRHCIMMENCCYGANEMMVLNMVRAGLFGELLHGEAAYIHDLRSLLFEDQSEGLWRRFPHINRDGNLYPTHGLGPVAQYMDINRGDRFDYLVSMSSLSVSLAEYRDKHIPSGSPKRKEKYKCGDMNTSLIKTAKGRTIMLQPHG
jgi:predicted dehydrogenase